VIPTDEDPGDAIVDVVREVFAVVLSVPVDDVPAHAHFFDELEGDSLQKLELSARLEERFTVVLSDDEVAGSNTVHDFARLVAAKRAG
jgi:acyl carrier protein